MDIEEEFVACLTVDNNEMVRLKQFYDRDVDIQICREKKKMETFRHDYTISYWYKDERELARLPYQNEIPYKKALQDILWLAQDYLTLFKFVGFYILKDMQQWVDEGGLKPPFGVLEVGLAKYETQGEFVLLKRRASFEKEIMYRCNDEALMEKYHFFVFNCGATFVPLNDNMNDNVVVPQSPFRDLIEDRDEIFEARICAADANFQATHPEGFMFSKPLSDTAVENVPEEILYAMDSLESAKLATSKQRVDQAVTLAEGYVERIRSEARQHLPRVVREHYGTLYQERRAAFMRPTLKESLEPLPSSLEVSRGPPPTFLIKPEELMTRYEDKICSLLNFPHLFFKAQTSQQQQQQGKNNAGNHQLDFAQRQLEDSVIQQQALFEQLYQELYRGTFMNLDLPIFAKLPYEAMPMLEHLRVRMTYNNLISKSDNAIHGLLPFFEKDVVTRDEMRTLLVRNFGIAETENQVNK